MEANAEHAHHHDHHEMPTGGSAPTDVAIVCSFNSATGAKVHTAEFTLGVES